MAKWNLKCPYCKNDFTHSLINDYSLSEFLMPMKPALPDDGTEIECPNCGHKATYRMHQLIYAR
jgi:DNA-directed RNA polymerase subunit RPC12/RpoP